MARVLGIDPGSRLTGWGIVEPHGQRCKIVAAGVIQAGTKRPLPERLLNIERGLTSAIQEHAPDEVAVEAIFYAKYANAAIKLGHARGVALLVAAQAGLAVHEYPPALVKKTVTGRGRADKMQVARIVAAMLGLRELPGEDATDALAVALTHVQARRMKALTAGR